MDLKQQILHYYRVDEMSLREIARRTGADRKTVTRLIDAYEAAIKSEPFREDQKTDEFIEIETGSEDILSQLENVMENGTKLPE